MAEDIAAARRILAALEAELAMDAWPDQVITWYRTLSPRGAWHQSPVCTTLQHRQVRQVRATLSEVGSKWCTQCKRSDELRGSLDRLRFTQALDALRTCVADLEAGEPVPAERVHTCLAAVEKAKAAQPGRAAKLLSGAAEILTIAAGTDASRTKAAEYTRVCALTSLAKAPPRHPSGVPSPSKAPACRPTPRVTLRPSRRVYGVCWDRLCGRVLAGASFEQAAAGARQGLLPPTPEVDELREVTVCKDGPVGIADLVRVWKDAVTEHMHEVLDDWVAQANENLARSQQVGPVTVATARLTVQAHGYELGMFPLRFDPDVGAVVTVPAVVAAEWHRLGVAFLHESDLCPPQYVEAVRSLMDQGMPMMTAMVAARGICAA